MFQLIEQPGNQPLVGCGASDVRESDADTISRLDPLAQRPCTERVLDRSDDGGPFVAQPGNVRWFDHGGLAVGQIDSQMSLAIGEIDIHTATQSDHTLLAWRRRANAFSQYRVYGLITGLSAQVLYDWLTA